MSNQLSVVDRRSLRKLEEVVEKGLATFVEVGNALRTIRDQKFYVESHKTFEAYCKDRWGMGRSRAYQLIEASEAAENVQHVGQIAPTNARQAAELAKAPKEVQAEVWRDVTEQNPEPTAKEIKDAVDRRVGSENVQHVGQNSPTEGDQKTVDAVSVSSIVKDSLDRDVPESLRGKYAIGAQLAAIGRKVDVIKREVIELADQDGGWFIPTQEIELVAKEFKDKISESAYWTACPRCKGNGCKRCDDSGFIPKSRKGQLSAEDKEALGV